MNFFRWLSVFAPAALLASGALTPLSVPAQSAPAERFLRLEELEKQALANNPTMAQAEAIVRGVLGRVRQTQHYPNPVLGYSADDILGHHYASVAHQ